LNLYPRTDQFIFLNRHLFKIGYLKQKGIHVNLDNIDGLRARIGWARIGWARIGWARIGCARIGWARIACSRIGYEIGQIEPQVIRNVLNEYEDRLAIGQEIAGAHLENLISYL
jgi:hypothetical protein